MKRFKSLFSIVLCMGMLLPLLPALPARAADNNTLFDIGNGDINIALAEVEIDNPAYKPPEPTAPTNPDDPPVPTEPPVPEKIKVVRLVVQQQGFPQMEYEDFNTELTIAGQSQTNGVTIDTSITDLVGTYPELKPFTVNILLSALYIDCSIAAIDVRAGTTARINFTGATTLISGGGKAGLHVAPGAEVTLTGLPDAAGSLGSLRAYGGANAAGIGGNASAGSGKIIINGGFITAQGNGSAYDIGGATPAQGEVQILGGSVWPVNERISSAYNSSLIPAQPLYPVLVPIRRGNDSLAGLEVSGPYITPGGSTRTVSAAKEHGADFPKYMSAMVWLPANESGGQHQGYQVGPYTGGMAQVVAGVPNWDQNRIYWGYEPEPSFNLDLGDITIRKGSEAGKLTVKYGSGKPDASIYAEDQIQIYGKGLLPENRVIVDGEGLYSTVRIELVELKIKTTKGAALDLQNRADVAVALLGENRLESSAKDQAAIRAATGSRIAIDGSVEYRLFAVSTGGGAGIGGGNGDDGGGTIIINGGLISATGSTSAAGIGGGNGKGAGKVTINGGIVVAQNGGGSAFDIGSGSGNKTGLGTEINGGNIYCYRQQRSTKSEEIIEGANNGRGPVYPVTVPYEYRGLQVVDSPVRYTAITITDTLAYGTIFPFQISACIWIPVGEYDGTITVGAAAGGCATVVESPNREQNIVYWKSVVIMTDSLLAGVVGQDYSAQLVSVNKASGKWSIVAGTLPPGLVLNGSTIQGVPTTPGRYTFTVMITLSNGDTETRALSLQINNAPYTPPAPGEYQDKDKDPIPATSSGTHRVQTESGTITLPYTRTGRTIAFVIDHSDSTRITDLATKQVTFDVSGMSSVDSVTMDKTALVRLRDAGLTVRIDLPLGSFTLTPPASSSLVRKASDQVTFTIKKAESTSLNRDQRNAAGSNAVYQVSAFTGPEQITVFDAAITVSIPYSVTSGTSNFRVWYLDRLGMTEEVPFTYSTSARTLTFDTKNLAHFIIGYDTSWRSPFYDVSSSDWFYSDVRYMVLNGIDSGTSDTQFSPYANLTRGMLVTMLGRMAGIDPSRYSSTAFTDVPRTAPYAGYVEWARSNNIVSGVGSNSFAPDRTITREDIAVILVRFNSYLNKTLPAQRNAITFSDQSSISAYARESVNIIYRANIMSEYTGTAFYPKGTVTRAEISSILHRYSQRAF